MPHWAKIVKLDLSQYEKSVLDLSDKVKDYRDIGKLLYPKALDEDMEKAFVICLGLYGQVLALVEIGRGNHHQVPVCSKQVFRVGIAYGAAGVIVVHNDPNGVCYPSQQDVDLTKILIDSGKIVGIPVIDHVIIAGISDYFSMSHEGVGGFKEEKEYKKGLLI